MKRTIAAVAAGALLMASSPVLAGGSKYRHHGGYHHGGHGDNDDEVAYLVGGLLGGLLLGSLLTQYSNRQNSYRPAPVYAAPPPRARYDCKPTTGTGYVNGRLAAFGGTFCYDAGGNGYVVSGSEYFIGYVQ